MSNGKNSTVFNALLAGALLMGLSGLVAYGALSQSVSEHHANNNTHAVGVRSEIATVRTVQGIIREDVAAVQTKVSKIQSDVGEIKGDIKVLLERSAGPR